MFRDKEIEQSVLACLILDKTCLEKIKKLKLEDFTFEDTRELYKAIKTLTEKNEAVDIITVNNKLKEKYEKIGNKGIVYLSDITSKLPTTANYNFYVRKLKQETNKRKLEEITKKLRDGTELKNTNETIKEFLINFEETEKQLEEHKYIISLADVSDVDYTKRERVTSGIKEIDKKIGGFYMGEVSIWTGKTGQGKSTFVNQMVCEAINQNYSVCLYSGELINSQLQNWINLQLAGEENIISFVDEYTGKISYGISKQLKKQIQDWYRDKLYIYNNEFEMESVNHASILDIFKKAHQKYGCKVFVVDNLMSARFINKSKDDYYTQQSCFVGELVAFAKSNNVHIHIIAHPKKTVNDNLESEDISGTMDIANRADNVFVISKTDKEKHTEKKEDGKFIIRKNRSDGINNCVFNLYFNKKSRRFSTTPNELKHYNWGDVPLPF